MADVPPPTKTLEQVLSAFGDLHSENRISIVGREPSVQGTAVKEIVSYRDAAGREGMCWCKYGKRRLDARRGGAFYEATIYRRFLSHLHLPVPKLFGAVNLGDHEFGLFLEFLPDAVRINKSRTAGVMELAAAWIGEFHRRVRDRLSDEDASVIQAFDRSIVQIAVDEAVAAAGQLGESTLAERIARASSDLTAALFSAPRTLIHGEYYPRNILLVDGRVYPVDWETASLGPGALDLASLTEGWPSVVAAECERAYVRARWPDGHSAGFAGELDAARLYWQLQWLPKRARHTPRAGMGKYVARLDSSLAAVERR